MKAWLVLLHECEYNDWWTERNAEASLSYAYMVITAWDNQRVVGTVTIKSDQVNFATIDDLVVRQNYQKKGIGSALMNAAINKIRELKVKHVQLFPIPGRETFFTRFGFVIQNHATVMDLKADDVE
ncbi:MAG: GNAT family N-acetyltransferase [Planctomycetes bacterium]|nr:GNAT family N-acetyltransferase [Planctomycetota bacterium]